MKPEFVGGLESGQVSQDIKRLLFANPSIAIKTSKSIIGSLKFNTAEQNANLFGWLQENLAIFKSKYRDIKDDLLQKDLYERIYKHVEQWEKEFGEVSLGDLRLLTNSTDAKLVDLGWELGRITPSSIAKLLDEYLVGQDKYKQELGLTIYTHILRMRRPELNIPKSNLLVFGPSGVGKTFGIKIMADMLDINHGVLNFERLVPEGIQGNKISDPFTRVLGAKKNDMILVGDEVDKIQEEQILQELLSILDDNNVISFPTTFGTYREYREIPSRNVTSILCGKFDKLKKIVSKRLNTNRVGYNTGDCNVLTQEDIYARVNLNDIKEALGSDEICGRIGSFVCVKQLSSDDLINIMLNKKDSIFSRYQAFFNASNIGLVLTNEGAREISDITVEKYKELGVRGLEIVVKQLLKEAMLKVGEKQDKILRLDQDYVRSHLNTSTNM